MKKQVEIRIPPDKLEDARYIHVAIQKKLKLKPNRQFLYQVVRRSIDARKQPIVYALRVAVFFDEKPPKSASLLADFKDVGHAPEVCVIGAGSAGYFAALKLIAMGIKPIVFERGKDVRQRRRDLRAIQQFGEVNPDSNYCYGEGGAGTYSDGKLYTRSHKRGNIQEILQLLVEHGANPDILIDAHPHIGSNKLPQIITAIRETIEKYGGEVHFESRLTDIFVEDDHIKGI